MSLTNKIFLSLILGIVLGSLFNNFASEASLFLLDPISVIGVLFISALKMLIVPVVFFSIVSGVTNLEDTTSLGRIGGKSIFLYLFTTFIAISFALIFASIINPGVNANFVLGKDFNINPPPPITSVIENLIPKNPIKSLSEGNMLQIIIFAIIVGITITKMKIDRKVKLKEVFIAFNDLFLK